MFVILNMRQYPDKEKVEVKKSHTQMQSIYNNILMWSFMKVYIASKIFDVIIKYDVIINK